MKILKKTCPIILLLSFFISGCFSAKKQNKKNHENFSFVANDHTLFPEVHEVIIKAFIPVVQNKTAPEAEKYLRERYSGKWFNKFNGLLPENKAFFHAFKNESNNVIAAILFYPTEVPEKVYVEKLAVLPTYQKKGLGKRLIFSIFQQCPKIKTIELRTLPSNQNAQRFYEKLGFSKVSETTSLICYKLEKNEKNST